MTPWTRNQRRPSCPAPHPRRFWGQSPAQDHPVALHALSSSRLTRVSPRSWAHSHAPTHNYRQTTCAPHAPVHTHPQTHARSPGTQGHTHSTSPRRGSQQLLSHPDSCTLPSRTSVAGGSSENLTHSRKKESGVPRAGSRPAVAPAAPVDTSAHLLALRQAPGPAPSVQGKQGSSFPLGAPTHTASRHHAPPLLAELGPCHPPGLSLNVTRKSPLWTELPTLSDP